MVPFCNMVQLGPRLTLLDPLDPVCVIWAPGKICEPHMMRFTKTMSRSLHGLTLAVPLMGLLCNMVPLGPRLTSVDHLDQVCVIWAPAKMCEPHNMRFTLGM